MWPVGITSRSSGRVGRQRSASRVANGGAPHSSRSVSCLSNMIRKSNVLLAGCLGVFALFFGCRRWDGLAPGVTAESVAAIRVGDSRAEVARKLGPPFREEPKSSKYYPAGSTILYYATDLSCTFCRYPRLLVHMTPEGRVESVYLEEFYGFDDEGVYGTDKNRTWGSTSPTLPSRSGS